MSIRQTPPPAAAVSVPRVGTLTVRRRREDRNRSSPQNKRLNYVGGGKKREMLQVLIDAYPLSLSDADAAARADMALSGTFDKALRAGEDSSSSPLPHA